jgi:hypothetical protein
MPFMSTHIKVARAKKAVSKQGKVIFKTGPAFTVSQELIAIASDPKRSEDFLKSAGIIVRAGKLAPEYSA